MTVVPYTLLSEDILSALIKEFLYGSLESSEQPLDDLEASIVEVRSLLKREQLVIVVDEESEHCSIQPSSKIS